MSGEIKILAAAGIVAAAIVFFGVQNPGDAGIIRRPVSDVDYRPWPLPDAERRLDRLDDRQAGIVERLECRDGVCRRVPVDAAPTPAAGIVPMPSEASGCNGSGMREERSVIVRRGLFGRGRGGNGLFGRRCGG